MNRRQFIKSAGVAAALPAISLTCRYEDDEKGPEKKESSKGKRWEYVVYCFERGQGEWVFSQNTRGSFNYQREYISLEEDVAYCGFMDGGKLHFATLEEAQDFVDIHMRAKDDTDLIDSIYDIYYVDYDNLDYESCQPTETQVANYWFNGDTGRQITWVSEKPRTKFHS